MRRAEIVQTSTDLTIATDPSVGGAFVFHARHVGVAEHANL